MKNWERYFSKQAIASRHEEFFLFLIQQQSKVCIELNYLNSFERRPPKEHSFKIIGLEGENVNGQIDDDGGR